VVLLGNVEGEFKKVEKVVGGSVVISVVGRKVEVRFKMEMIVGIVVVTVVVVMSSCSFGTKGYFKQGKAIGGPNIFSKT
jgi:hypothetical protein